MVRNRLEPESTNEPGRGIGVDRELDRAHQVVPATLHLVDEHRPRGIGDEAGWIVGGEPKDFGLVQGVEAATALGMKLP